ncbi:MAG: hypothetical protein GF355_09625 [Candidatus Eisenbacteria bacterium]|nr:hypothetical protein [Candidatus Eisenbacteria bacterium]
MELSREEKSTLLTLWESKEWAVWEKLMRQMYESERDGLVQALPNDILQVQARVQALRGTLAIPDTFRDPWLKELQAEARRPPDGEEREE